MLANSKANWQLQLGLIIGLAFIAGGIAIKVIFGENVIEFVLAAIGLSGGNGALATARSMIVDAPIRQQYAALDVAVKAKEADIPVAPMPSRLATWKPEEGTKE